jgi:hypothetical protein
MTWLVAILLMIGVCLLSNLIMWVKFQNNYNHLIRIERDLNDVKNYLEHRAISESLIKGIGDIGSPWKLRPELVDKYDKFQDELRSFYQKLIENGTINENDMDDRCLFWEIAPSFP